MPGRRGARVRNKTKRFFQKNIAHLLNPFAFSLKINKIFFFFIVDTLFKVPFSRLTVCFASLVFTAFLAVTGVAAAPLTQVASINPSARTQKAAPVRVVKKKVSRKAPVKRRARRVGPSVAMLAGLRNTPDPLELSSSVAYMVDQDTNEVFFEKNADVKLPIASVTKLMTALVIAESALPMNEKLRVTRDDYVRSRAKSKLRVGMVFTRKATLQAALMSSDNRAAHMLARTYPGGIREFVRVMNEKAEELGMEDSHFADPTGLNNANVSTARDLGILAGAAHKYDVIREASTTPVALLNAGRWKLRLQTTNRLIGDPRWNVGLQKTGFTTAAGRCMVVQSEFAGHRLVMVVLDSATNGKRADDMLRMRRWLEEETEFEKEFAQVSPYEIL